MRMTKLEKVAATTATGLAAVAARPLFPFKVLPEWIGSPMDLAQPALTMGGLGGAVLCAAGIWFSLEAETSEARMATAQVAEVPSE